MSRTGLDSTERKEQPSRAVSEARFQHLFDEAQAMSIQGYLPDGTVVYWNRASEDIYGYGADEAIGANLLDLIIPGEMRTEVAAAMRRMFETGKGSPPERLRLRHKDGHRVAVYSSHTIIAIPGQSPVLFCMDADMSALERVEAELRVAATAFESPQAMLITDPNGTILRVNRAFTAETGYSNEELEGQTPRILKSGRHERAFYEAMWAALTMEGTWQGEIWDRRKNGEIYPKWMNINAVRDDQGITTHYISTQIDITERKAADNAIRYLAFHDSLTRLPNRRLFHDRLRQALSSVARSRQLGALLFLDLDNFKTLNDTLGHDYGDQVLQQVADRLKRCVRESDTVARFGGDEFVLMLENLSQASAEAATQTRTVAEKVIATLNQVYWLDGHEYRSSPSIGVTLFGDQPRANEELLMQAELAMYQAKAAGRNTVRFFDPAMQVAVMSRAALETDLRDAIRGEQFILHYQAQVDAGGELTGAEALVRWQHPERGMIPPADFIPLAEENGLIVPIGRWVLETACEQLAAWTGSPHLARLTLSVNVSARQFRQFDFVDQVRDVLASSGANPARLKLELTESLVLEDIEQTIDTMKAIKRLGVRFSMDDFGTGQSSLAYLTRLPLDQLKIDRSFMRNIPGKRNDETIARTIITMSRGLDMEVMAEGVEREEQRQFLLEHGCRAFQGFLFGRPMTQEQLSEFARTPTPPHQS